MFKKKTKFGILGLAKSGIAAAYKLKELGFHPFLSEFKSAEKIPNSLVLQRDFQVEFGGHTEKILESDIIIVSPGIPLKVPILELARTRKINLISEIEFGFLIKHTDSKIIAITGSNGKSTTVSLINHILTTAGYKSILAGNIGNAFTSFPIEKPGIDVIVLELSSFQLDLVQAFRADIAGILNITPDHLNRYDSFEDYARAKFKIFANQTPPDFAILNLDDEIVKNLIPRIFVNKLVFASSKQESADVYSERSKIFYKGEIISTEDLPIQGPHNIANIMAALLAVSPFQIELEIILNALYSFRSLPHRLEFVDQIEGIKFYNDSKATNTESVKYALQSFQKPIRIIMGGAGKGEDFSILNDLLKKNTKKIYLLGSARMEMAEAFGDIVEIELFDDFRSAILKSYYDSQSDDIIVLSPACTSYDMFSNFEERGNLFKKIVRELTDEK